MTAPVNSAPEALPVTGTAAPGESADPANGKQFAGVLSDAMNDGRGDASAPTGDAAPRGTSSAPVATAHGGRPPVRRRPDGGTTNAQDPAAALAGLLGALGVPPRAPIVVGPVGTVRDGAAVDAAQPVGVPAIGTPQVSAGPDSPADPALLAASPGGAALLAVLPSAQELPEAGDAPGGAPGGAAAPHVRAADPVASDPVVADAAVADAVVADAVAALGAPSGGPVERPAAQHVGRVLAGGAVAEKPSLRTSSPATGSTRPADAQDPVVGAGSQGGPVSGTTVRPGHSSDSRADAPITPPAAVTPVPVHPPVVATAPVSPPSSTAHHPASAPDVVPHAELTAVLGRLRSHGDGTSEFTLALHPAELGSVGVTATVRDGAVTVTLACADPAARDAVSAALPALRAELAASGLAGVDVSVGGFADPGPRRQRDDVRRADDRRPTDVIEAPAGVAPPRRTRVVGRAGLDQWL